MNNLTEKNKELIEFLEAIINDYEGLIHLQTIGAKGTNGIEPKPLKTKIENLKDNRNIQKLKDFNKDSGIYFVVNSGGNKDAEIEKFNAFFMENDNLSIIEQNIALDNCPLPPSIRIETKKSVHAYWLVDGDCSANEWKDIQLRLIDFFNGDKRISNPARLMRLPNFNHVSFDKVKNDYQRKMVNMVAFEPETRFTFDEMQKAFPKPKVTEAEIKDSNKESFQKSKFKVNVEKDILPKLKKVSVKGDGWMACCPAHNDNNPSLSIKQDGDKMLLFCHSKKCSFVQIVQKLGLSKNEQTKSEDLFYSNAC